MRRRRELGFNNMKFEIWIREIKINIFQFYYYYMWWCGFIAQLSFVRFFIPIENLVSRRDASLVIRLGQSKICWVESCLFTSEIDLTCYRVMQRYHPDDNKFHINCLCLRFRGSGTFLCIINLVGGTQGKLCYLSL